MNGRVALLQIASQSIKGGDRMPRNPQPDQIGMGGRILSVQVAGSPRNTQRTPARTETTRTAPSRAWSRPRSRETSPRRLAATADTKRKESPPGEYSTEWAL